MGSALRVWDTQTPAEADLLYLRLDGTTNPSADINWGNNQITNLSGLDPDTDDVGDIGTTSLRWNTIYVVNLQAGGAATSVAYSRLGTATTGHSLAASDDLLVTGGLEVDSASFFDAAVTHNDSLILNTNKQIIMGTASESQLDWSGAQSNPSVVWGLGTSSKTIIFVEAGDSNIDFLLSNQANPTIVIQSSDATDVTQRLLFSHNQVDGLIRTDSGGLRYDGAIQIGGAIDAVAYSRFGTNTTTRGISSVDDVLFSGTVEFDGHLWIDSTVNFNTTATFNGDAKFQDDKGLGFGNIFDALLDYSSVQSISPTLVWGLSAQGNSIIFTARANVDKDHDHSAQTNSTIFIHSVTDPDTDNTQWISFAYGVIATGSGSLTLNPADTLVVSANIEIRSTDAFHYGDPTTNTTWKIVRDGTKLAFQRRESGSYVEKGFFDTSFYTNKLVITDSADGIVTALEAVNSQAAVTDSLNESAEIKFGFGSNIDVARISADKLKDYTSAAKEDSRLSFWVDDAGTLTEVFHVMPDGIMLMLEDPKIRFASTAGGKGSIQYKDLAGSNRAAFLLAGNNVVAVVSRGANGTVEIRANTSTGGNGGEVTVATFEDSQIVFNEDAGDVDFRVEGLFDANLFVTDAGNDNIGMGVVPSAKRQLDIGGLFNGNTRLSLTDTLSSDAQAQQLFVGGNVEAAEDQPAHGVRIAPTLTKFGSGAHANFDSVVIFAPIVVANGSSLATASTLRIEGSPTGATKNFALLVHGLTHFGGDVKPEAGSTYDLGNSSTLKWANVWSDLVNGSDFAMSNKWRMLEAELYEGYPKGWAIGHDTAWKDGKSVFKNPDMIDRDQRPVFAVTDEFIEYKGRRLTPAILDKLLELVE